MHEANEGSEVSKMKMKGKEIRRRKGKISERNVMEADDERRCVDGRGKGKVEKRRRGKGKRSEERVREGVENMTCNKIREGRGSGG